MTGGENTTAVDEMTAVEGALEFFAAGGRGFAAMTDAPTGMRGADGLTFALGRRTGAKASAADQPIRKTQMTIKIIKMGNRKGPRMAIEKGTKSDIQ